MVIMDVAFVNGTPSLDPLPHPIEIRSSSFVLFLLYATVTLVVLFQICRIIYYRFTRSAITTHTFSRHNLLHYQFLFLIYSFFWGCLRSVFWLLIPWTSVQEIFLQGIALQIQFWTFTLIVLFFSQMTYKIEKTWATYRTLALAIYVFLNLLFLSGFLAFATIPLVQITYNTTTLDQRQAYFVSFMYMVLAFLLVYFGWRLYSAITITKNVQVCFCYCRQNHIVGVIVASAGR
eukprot:TRINITY_DN4664_c0_g1_i29.p1 TRINITY_DN4664_c0_g1~~TRINITY_DN4664_c0_g1_i29.p1  ORF type:complete len:233 (+),score=14.58 TRINITY_DN4664_c0_g1_i29:251-949(+)